MTEVPQELAALIDVERELSAPSPLDRARNRRALARNLGIAGVLGAGTAKGSVAAWLAAHAGVKLAATIALVAAGTSTLAWLATSQHMPTESAPVTRPPSVSSKTLATPTSTPPLGEAAVAPPALPPAAPLASVGRTPLEAKPLTATSAPAARAPATPSVRAFATDTDDQLAGETKLITSAQTALRSGDPARSLALLERVRREFPSGALREEAAATRVFAFCQLGRRADARAAAASFLQTFPRSLLAARVSASCP